MDKCLESEYITRYFTLEKFLDFINTGELYFARFDSFEDKGEGMMLLDYFKKNNINTSKFPDTWWKQEFDKSIVRKQFFASCWTCGKEELYMWERYKYENTIAVTTGKNWLSARFQEFLIDCREGNQEDLQIHGGIGNPVGYFNPELFDINKKYKFGFGFVKHHSFEFEQEYRFVIRKKDGAVEQPHFRWLIPEFGNKHLTIITNPYSTDEFHKMIEKHVQSFGYKHFKIETSKYREHFTE